MDTVELGRQEAARIHARLVEQGIDPWDPLALVEAAADRCGIIDITGLKPGSALLAQARASYDPHSHSILHEDTGNAFMNAFLIGHEIGHATLGDARLPDQARDPDPARSVEAAPDGEERVADYSRKSRREVQMDLFSRELLMPRAFLREQHLAGMSANAIAAKLGAPYGAVAQQLLDALLLPSVELRQDAGDTSPLNDRQARAAAHRGGAFLLEAGPGTGKTKTLVSRICDLIDKDAVDPRTMVVLTYSNKAAGELSERIAKRAPQAAAAMWIGTFHAYGLNLVRSYHRELGFAREPRLLDHTEAIDLMLDRVAGLDLTHYRDLSDPTDKLRDLLSAISRAQDEVVLAPDYAALVDKLAASDGAPGGRADRAREVARVYESYSDLKRSLDCVDFGDLVALPTHLLETRPEIARAVAADIGHILVDEYQDVNRASVRLLQQLSPGGRNLWCVGDVRQSIYRFRGASSFNLSRFETQDFRGGSRDQLEVNYRSVGEIVDSYQAFAEGMQIEGATPVALKSNRGPSGNPVEFRSIDGDTEREIDALADGILEMRNAGHAFRDQALLCSGNDRLAKIGAGLEARGIPVLYLGSLFERPEVKDLLAWLSLLIDRRAMALAREFATPGLTIPLGDLGRFNEALNNDTARPLDWIKHPPAGLSEPAAAAVAAYSSLLAGFDGNSPPWDTLAQLLLDRSRVAAQIAGAGNMQARAKGIALWQLMNFVRAQPAGRSGAIPALLERIRRLVRLSDDRDLRHIPQAAGGIDAMRLMTMHASKGLEFRVVHIPGMAKGTLPRNAAAPACPPPDGMIEGSDLDGESFAEREHMQEQQCLFYVALSRARDRLLVYAPGRTKKSERQPSPFVARLGSGLSRLCVTPSSFNLPPDNPSIPMIYHGQPLFRQSELALYERCARRFFYTHILKLGGRRTTTAYEDMHEIVRQAVRELIATGTIATDTAGPDEIVERLWSASPLAALPAAPAYRRLAGELVRHFVAMNDGRPIAPAHRLSFTLAGATIEIEIDYAQTDAAGVLRELRQVQTGHRRTTAMEGAAVMATLLAVNDQAPGCSAEILFLSDAGHERLSLKDGPLDTRRRKLEANIAAILSGQFPTKASPRSCPKCPAFFMCGTVPGGTFEKNFA
ncbi:superfamily I DNA/RNA helicase [Rhizobium sp. BK650]|uniref:ATP-dependent helicase n=1 Tax=Rhizobium sp. BK650 TaxID=2586990 RepID=UPI0016122B62|nr:ATP-dependent helicase [Rhizobium sp. BK650]MBB3660030.1 superfamily I DNA/RNA helicase [Rhizobium sp. BK650]